MLQFTGERFIPTQSLSSDEIGIEHLHRYHSIIPFIRNKTVLDIACGEGYGTALIGKYAKKVIGVDIDEACIEWASGNYASNNDKLSFLQGTVSSIPLDDNSIDVVISFETIEHVTEADQHLFMSEVKRVLKPDGLLIISTPNTAMYSIKQDLNNQFHLKEFAKEELKNFLNEYFSHTYYFEQGYEIVSTITSDNLEATKQLQVYNWDRELKAVNRKYLIVIAANQEVPDTASLSSAVIQVDKDFWDMIDYIKSLQKDQKEKEQLKSITQELTDEISQASTRLAEKEGIIADLNTKLITLHQQVDELNNRLSEIYSSDGYKLLSVYYRFKGRVLPENSARYKQIKKFVGKFKKKRNEAYATFHLNTPLQIDNEGVTSFDIIEFPVFEHPRVSIIIPVYNGWEMNYKCLRSIYKNTHGVSYEIIIADDLSDDETANIKDYIKNITVVRNETNLGFLKNCNNAVKYAKGDYIHFLNNDTQVTTGWLSSLTELLDNRPDVGMVGSKLVYPNGRLQEAGGIIWQDGSGWNFGHNQDPELPEFNYVKEVDYISGASIMLRKETWDALNGFDENFSPAYCEDTDLAFQIRKHNLKVVYQPLSVVVHHEGYSHGSDQKPQGLTQIKLYQKLNVTKLKDKWKEDLKNQLPRATDVFWARDRSKEKKTILVIDHYVPEFDKDAGSRTVFQYLEILVELGYNVKFLSDNFYKSEPYTTILQQKGIEVLHGSFYANNWQQWILDNQQFIHFVLLNRPHISIKYIDFLKKKIKAKILYYGHDLHYVRELEEYALTKDESKKKTSAEWKKKEFRLFEKSDVILTPTSKEKELIKADLPDKVIEVMPAFFYPEIAKPITDFNARKGLLFVGGFVHTPNVDAVEWFVNKVLPLVQKQIPDIQLFVVGSNTPDRIKQLASDNVIIKGFLSDDHLQELYRSVRMAVMPLRYGAGLKGKTVEAMVKALPLVSTSFGIEGMPGIDSILQANDTEESFANAILSSYNDIEKLERTSASLVKYASEHYTKEKAGAFFASLFK
jgi:O-antigen biosynthesis protein